jgi:hypothetical protein
MQAVAHDILQHATALASPDEGSAMSHSSTILQQHSIEYSTPPFLRLVYSDKSVYKSYLLVVHSYDTHFLRVVHRHFILSFKVLQ